jgi:hypothetical protein
VNLSESGRTLESNRLEAKKRGKEARAGQCMLDGVGPSGVFIKAIKQKHEHQLKNVLEI